MIIIMMMEYISNNICNMMNIIASKWHCNGNFITVVNPLE